jgi:hypothetical protein
MYNNKYLKYKQKYLEFKNQLAGSTKKALVIGPILSKIADFASCKEVITAIIGSKKQIKDTRWVEMDISNFNTKLNFDISNANCNFIDKDNISQDKDISFNIIKNKEACNRYINKCKLKTLYKKYFPDIVDELNIIYDISLLNRILLKTIPTDNINDSNFLLSLGANLTEIPTAEFIQQQLTSATIPNSIITIGGSAFSKNRLTSVNIPNSVITIGNSAFHKNQLTSVTIPNSVITIDSGAFSSNELTSVEINMPSSLETINHYAFANNQLKSITIPNTVTTIEQGAFDNNKLTSVTIPNSVTTISYWAFGSNPLTSVTIPRRFESKNIHIFGTTHNIRFNYTD